MKQKRYRTLNAKLDAWLLLIIIFIMTGAVICISMVSNTLLRSKAVDSSRRELIFVASQLEDLFARVENESLFFITDEGSKLEYSVWETGTEYGQMLYRNSLARHLRNFFFTQPNLLSASFYDHNGQFFYRDHFDETLNENFQSFRDTLETFSREDATMDWVLVSGLETGDPCFTLLRKTFNIHGTYRGILALQVDPAAVSSIYRGAFDEETQLVALNQRAQVCFSSSSVEADQAALAAIMEHADDTAPFRLPQDRLALTLSSEPSGLYLCAITSEPVLYRNSHILVTITIIFGVFSAILAKLILGRVTRRLLLPLADIVGRVQQLSDGDLSARITPSSNDELALLSEQINNMAGNTQRLMRRIEEKGEQQKKYELAYLQMQMQPHFFYNALETVNGMIALGDQENASRMVGYLSNFYRGVLNYGESFITIQKEVEIAKNYLRIMQQRYYDRFDFQFSIQPEVLGCTIPKLTLQPLLENSVVHGFIGVTGAGHIEISGTVRDGTVALSVEDDGVGIGEGVHAPDKRDGMYRGSSFGLKSIEERLKLYYGEEARMEIVSEAGQGTRITLLFPERSCRAAE